MTHDIQTLHLSNANPLVLVVVVVLAAYGLSGPAAVIAQAWPDALVLENSLRSAGLGSVELRNAALKNWLRMRCEFRIAANHVAVVL